MSAKVIDIHDLSDGIDRKLLQRVKQRFVALNRERYRRTLTGLSERQQDFLELLPLIFHVNHPMLPGYVSHQTPSGVAHYKPSKEDLRRAQGQARSFRYNSDLATRRMSIDALFIMGSVGTVGQSESSDLDIWVCHNPALNGEELAQLRLKCQHLSRWAEQHIRLEVHFFLMDPSRFQLGQLGNLTSEGSGSAQHYLLLDEFYRTALWLAGKVPLWWFVPASQEANYQSYADTLLRQRFVRANDVIDFGGVSETPMNEFVGAGIWHLYKGIEAPYKSMLKLLLLEVYAADEGREPLALEFKAALYAREPDPNQLDAYVMVYRRLAAYLRGRGQTQRLELVRRCLYFKVNKPLTRTPVGGKKSWQRQLLEALVAEWRWRPHQVYMLDSRRHWKAPDVLAERTFLVSELSASYRLISGISKATHMDATISDEELMVLGRKLHAAFERKAGKVEWLNPGISDDLEEPALCLMRQPDTEGNPGFWELYRGARADVLGRTNTVPAIKKSRYFLELFLWCYCNGMLSMNTRLDVDGAEWELDEAQKQHLLQAFRQWLPMPMTRPAHEAFKSGAVPNRLLMVFNLGAEPQQALRKKGLHLLSNRQDALDYSGLRENLVLTVDIVQVNSWREIVCRNYSRDPLVNSLLFYFRLVPPGRGLAPPELTIRCLNTHQGPVVVQRLEELWRDLVGCYYSGTRPANSRYLLETGDEYLLLQFVQQQPQILRFKTRSALLEKLSAPQLEYSPLVVDRYALMGQPVKLLCEVAGRPGIYVLYQVEEDRARVTLLDEKASLFSVDMPYYSHQTLLRPLHYFILSVLTRQNLVPDLTREPASDYSVEFYEWQGDNGRGYLEARSITSDINQLAFVSIQVIAEPALDSGLNYTIYCDEQEFSELEHGEDLFSAVAVCILERRQGGQRYPCYITDLDLSQCRDLLAPQGGLQLSHYLSIKAELEQRLDLALQQL
ncbi:class I adenylate cyclase [Marinimicrobium sp. ABcell2]|uniref:class I adenylate cyclase n=1 Tax=Marinimicrobium sp. ABcell2 TaxID=3069751 RepID=UPI0027B1F45D|nr:class I adenylate cyclase [Marinimicrobium sp. ABcell2]MDQ2076860.1 class I adenylate cyclase [Marinimicrobium sp. ABcell2]